MSIKDIVKKFQKTKVSKKVIYKYCIEIKNEN